MKKAISIILVLTILLFVLTGCYGSTDIDKYFYIVALGIDAVPDDEKNIKVSVQIASNSDGSSSSSGSSQSDNYKIYTAEANTLDIAFSILNNYLSKKINLSHCNAVIISEDIAKQGVQKYFATLSNNTELRPSCELLISSTTALDVLNNVSNSGEAFSSRLYDYLTTSTEYTGFTINSTFSYFFDRLENYQVDPSAIYSKVSDGLVQNIGTAVFKDDKMVGNLDILDTISHLIVTNELNSAILSIPSPFESDENIDLNINLYKNTDISIDIVNNSPVISLDIYPEGSILSSGEKYDYTDSENIKKAELSANNYINEIVKNYLYKISKDFNSDIVGFSGIYSATIPTKDEFDKVHWNNIFQDSFFKISVKTHINSNSLFNRQ